MRADWVKSVMERYGQTLRIETADATEDVQAFLQPLTENSERVPSAVTSLGWLDTRLWLYLGREKLTDGDAVAWGESDFGCARPGPMAWGTRSFTGGRCWRRKRRRRSEGDPQDPPGGAPGTEGRRYDGPGGLSRPAGPGIRWSCGHCGCGNGGWHCHGILQLSGRGL